MNNVQETVPGRSDETHILGCIKVVQFLFNFTHSWCVWLQGLTEAISTNFGPLNLYARGASWNAEFAYQSIELISEYAQGTDPEDSRRPGPLDGCFREVSI